MLVKIVVFVLTNKRISPQNTLHVNVIIDIIIWYYYEI